MSSTSFHQSSKVCTYFLIFQPLIFDRYILHILTQSQPSVQSCQGSSLVVLLDKGEPSRSCQANIMRKKHLQKRQRDFFNRSVSLYLAGKPHSHWNCPFQKYNALQFLVNGNKFLICRYCPSILQTFSQYYNAP